MDDESTDRRRRRAGVVLVTSVLLVGAGAVATLNASLWGSEFSAAVPGADATLPTGALVSVTGDPVVHTFDLTTYNESVEGVWSIDNTGTVGVTFDGTLTATGAEVPTSLAAQLVVQYADASGAWRDAGTLASPVSYVTAVGAGSALAAAASERVLVRISLADPTALEGVAGETLSISAAFSVGYAALA
jgi:hypothetical protein